MSATPSRTQLPREVATALGISVDSVARYAREGLIPFAMTPKGHRRYNLDEVLATLASEQRSEPRVLAARGPAQRRPLVAGPVVNTSPQSRLREDLRATRTAERNQDTAENGSRFARVPHPDNLEVDVLPKSAAIVRKLAKTFSQGGATDPEASLVGAAESWYLGGNDKRVVFIPMISEATAKASGLWDDEGAMFHAGSVGTAEKRLARKLRASLPAGAGYSCSVETSTLHTATAAELLKWSEWILEDPSDPLEKPANAGD